MKGGLRSPLLGGWAMPWKAKGRRVVKASTGKTVHTARSSAQAKKVAAARNINYARGKGKVIPKKK